MRQRNDGIADPITLGLVALAVAVGCYFMFRSPQVDAPAEQVAEAFLKTQGVDVDFSMDKKSNPQIQSDPDHSK